MRNNFSKKKTKKIRKKCRLREEIDEHLKELEQKNSLTEQEIQDKNITSKRVKELESF